MPQKTKPRTTEDKLTPAARKALDQYLTDTRAEILLSAEKSATPVSGALEEISVHDISAAIARSRHSQPTEPFARFSRYLRVYGAVGLLVSAAGFTWLLSMSFLPSLSPDERAAYMVILVGLVIAGFSFFFSRLPLPTRITTPPPLAAPTTQEPDVAIDLLRRWADFELNLRLFAARRYGESKANAPTSSIIRKLSTTSVITQGDAARLRRILATRNRAAHGGLGIPATQSQQITHDLDRIESRLKRKT